KSERAGEPAASAWPTATAPTATSSARPEPPPPRSSAKRPSRPSGASNRFAGIDHCPLVVGGKRAITGKGKACRQLERCCVDTGKDDETRGTACCLIASQIPDCDHALGEVKKFLSERGELQRSCQKR